jgi:hypothetical protein
MVEGIAPLPACGDDCLDHFVWFSHDITGCNPQRHDATSHLPGVSLNIRLWGRAHGVYCPVNLDRQSRFAAKEVENVTSRRVLATEFEPTGS